MTEKPPTRSHTESVLTDEDRQLERVIARENARMHTARTEHNLLRARMHARNVREFVAMRRPEVVEAMERDRGLR